MDEGNLYLTIIYGVGALIGASMNKKKRWLGAIIGMAVVFLLMVVWATGFGP